MKIAFLFSGQGAQYPGMMKDIYESELAAKEVYDCADEVLGRAISELSFCGTKEELDLTHNTQPTVLTADLAAAEALTSHGIKPDVVAGFSLGEYAALAYSGAINRRDVFDLIQLRADAMQEAVAPGKGAMAAFVGASVEQVEEICSKVTKGYVVPANYNSPVQTVLSGSVEGVEEACELGEAAGIRCVKLAVSAPFHCALMEPAAKKLEIAFKNIEFNNPNVPVYMNVDGKPIIDRDLISEKLVRQAMSSVKWVDTLKNMQNDGVDIFIECGPGKTLSGLVKKTLDGVKILRVENVKTLEKTLEEINA